MLYVCHEGMCACETDACGEDELDEVPITCGDGVLDERAEVESESLFMKT